MGALTACGFLLEKILLGDRYFRSRLTSDMYNRFTTAAPRTLPEFGVNLRAVSTILLPGRLQAGSISAHWRSLQSSLCISFVTARSRMGSAPRTPVGASVFLPDALLGLIQPAPAQSAACAGSTRAR
jgi:hypothetical protein